MATKRPMWVLFGILVISAWILGSAMQVGAETMKFRFAGTAIKDERMPVGYEEGHVLGLQRMVGLAFFENGEIAKVRSDSIFDTIPGKGAQAIGYSIFTFDDGSTVVTRIQRLIAPGQSASIPATNIGDIIKGTGRFEGIKGTVSATGRQFPHTKEEPTRAANDVTWTYTLPTK
jgi:hypothetical protein